MSRSRHRRGARLLSALAALSMLGAVLPASTAAFSITSGSSFMPFWDCTYNWKWKSVGDPYTGLQNNGSFDHCFYLYQVGTPQANGTVVDGDSSHDTYMVVLTIDWDTNAIYWGTGEEPMKAKISTSVAGSSWYAGPTTMSSSQCGATLGLPLGPLSVTLAELCNSVILKRDSLNSSSAQWSASDVDRLQHVEFAYMVKVNQGVKPTFTATTTYPYYTKYATGDTFYGRPIYGFKAVMYGSTWVHKAP